MEAHTFRKYPDASSSFKTLVDIPIHLLLVYVRQNLEIKSGLSLVPQVSDLRPQNRCTIPTRRLELLLDPKLRIRNDLYDLRNRIINAFR